MSAEMAEPSTLYSIYLFLTGDYAVHLYILIGIYLILAQSFNLNFGVGRLFNLAHVAVYAVGAYTTALLSTVGVQLESSLGIPISIEPQGFLVCITASMIISGLFASLIGAISLKLEQDYFAIGTLAFSSVVTALLINWKSLTRGVLGIPGIPRPEFLGIDFYDNHAFFGLTFALVVLSQMVLYIFFRNSYARSLRAQAEFDHATIALGKNTRAIRNLSFFIASIFAGLAGSLFAYYINYIDPTSFAFTEMVFVLTIGVVGRPGSFWGVIFGAIFLVLLPEPLRFTGEVQGFVEHQFGLANGASLTVPVVGWIVQFFNFVSQPSVLGPMRQLLYAVILFGVVYINRERLFPVERQV